MTVRSRTVVATSAVLAVLGLTLAAVSGGQVPESLAWGRKYIRPSQPATPRRSHPRPTYSGSMGTLRHWNEVAVDASGLDHTRVAPGEQRVFGEQFGPGRSSRAMAIVHIAVFDVVNAIAGGYESYSRLPEPLPGASMDAAIAQAAHDTLVALYPSQRAQCDELLAADLAQIPAGKSRAAGIALGKLSAAAILTARADDGAAHEEARLGSDFQPSDLPGRWRQDPISQVPLALGAHWGEVEPFVLKSIRKYRVAPPPPLGSRAYADAFNEVRRLGGDGLTTPTQRTDDQSMIGIYWAYDGTPTLCAPPRLYNQVALAVADQMGSDVIELARLFALVNVAMADASVAIWESKYYYQVWRPVTGIREADAGTGPTGAGDGNPATTGDPGFMPLGAPATNLNGPNFTPPFPSYPSGHAGFGGALFETLRNFYDRDDIAFTFVSDELNGVTHDNQGNPRPLVPRSFASLSQAEAENARSRVYLGIHWGFDVTAGVAQGRAVADYVSSHAFRRRGPHQR